MIHGACIGGGLRSPASATCASPADGDAGARSIAAGFSMAPGRIGRIAGVASGGGAGIPAEAGAFFSAAERHCRRGCRSCVVADEEADGKCADGPPHCCHGAPLAARCAKQVGA